MSRFVRNANNTRIPDITSVRTALMLYDGSLPIGLISEECNRKGETDWVIYPNYAVLDSNPYIDILGIDLSLRRPEYIRNGIPHVFVKNRTVPDARDDLDELLSNVGLKTYDKFEFMLRYGGRSAIDRHQTVQRLPNDYYDFSLGIFGKPLSEETRYALRNIIAKKG